MKRAKERPVHALRVKLTFERLMTVLCATVVAAMAITVAVSLFNELEYHPAVAVKSVQPGLSPEPTPRASAAAPVSVAPSKTPGQALHEGRINNLINLLRSAAVRGDETTQRAMIEGIARHGDAAQLALANHLATETNPKAREALERAMGALQ